MFLSCSNCCSCGADVFPGPSDECSSCFADVVFSKVCAFQSVHWATLFCIRNVVLFRDLMVLKGRWKVLVTCVRITRVCFSETPWTNWNKFEVGTPYIRNHCFHPIGDVFSLISCYSSNMREPLQLFTENHAIFYVGFYSTVSSVLFETPYYKQG